MTDPMKSAEEIAYDLLFAINQAGISFKIKDEEALAWIRDRQMYLIKEAILAERKRAEVLENCIEELHKNYENTVGQGTQTIKDLRRDLGLAEEEITRLKAENDRLTASLARAHEAHWELLESSKPYQPGVMTNCSLPDNLRQQDRFKKAITSSKEILSDPTGKEAFERWKRMEAVLKKAYEVIVTRAGKMPRLSQKDEVLSQKEIEEVILMIEALDEEKEGM